MIGAISFRLKKKCQVIIYLVGTYDQINWSHKISCKLGEEYSTYDFLDPTNKIDSLIIDYGLDGNAVLRLIETKRYILKVESLTGERIELPYFQNEDNKLLKIDKDKNSISFQFINYLGRSHINFKNDDTTRISFEVIPDKMSYEEDYIGLTEALAKVCSELLLEHTGATSNVFSQTEDTSRTLLEQFIFLRQFCYSQNIYSLFESIKRNPDRVLVCKDECKPSGYGIPSKKFYTNPFTYGKGWKKNESKKNGLTFYLPSVVVVTQKQDNIDTPANRFIKFALQKFQNLCKELIRALHANGNVKQTECLKEAETIRIMLDDILRDYFFEEIGDLGIMPQNNQVLQKREGYSQIFFAYSMIDLALQLNWKGKDAIYEGESKNVALLYEYWLFFELYKIILSIEGCELVEVKDNPFLMSCINGINISLEQGKRSCQSFKISRLGTNINLYYNRTFSKTEFRTTEYEGSYSRPFRPDYTLAIYPDLYNSGSHNGERDAVKNGAVSYIHFDAKYRLTDLTSFIGKNEITEDEENEILQDKNESIINTYNRGDLLKMHTYNDAIRRTIGSYVLYPGSGDIKAKEYTTFSLYDEVLPGIGAFAIKPGMDTRGEAELRRFITKLIESKEKNNSRLNRMKYYMEIILSEPSIRQFDIRKSRIEIDKINEMSIQNGINGKICVLGYIRADSEDDYYYALERQGLLKSGSKFIFYFYAIKGEFVYTHHKDISKATYFRFYKNHISKIGKYKLEPILCKIESNELVSRAELVVRLNQQGFVTEEKDHNADFYYVLSVCVIDENWTNEEIKISDLNLYNGNDTFSPHSPKVLCY